jgi:hypothetical protein
MLTQEEIDALEPYCLNNPEMEMTPQDFVRLISMVRYTDSDIQEVEITPQMSISASMRANTINYYDGESVHHPEPHFDVKRLINRGESVFTKYNIGHYGR